MSNVNEMVERYIAAWNERDPRKRLELVARAYTEDANYTDPHRTGNGHVGISAMIAAVAGAFRRLQLPPQERRRCA